MPLLPRAKGLILCQVPEPVLGCSIGLAGRSGDPLDSALDPERFFR